MSERQAVSTVEYVSEVLDKPHIYQRSAPIARTVNPLVPDLTYEYPSSLFKIECNANEDFDLPLQLNYLAEDGTEKPYDLGTVFTLEFYVRPRQENPTIIKKLTVGAGILIINASLGQIELYLPQSVVASDLIVSKQPAQHWDYFLDYKGDSSGNKLVEFFRGPLVVHAGVYP